MPTYVRVKQPETGHEFSSARSAESAKAAGLTVLDKPATKSDGTPLPPKPYVRLSAAKRKPAPKSLPSKGRKATNTGQHKAASAKEKQ